MRWRLAKIREFRQFSWTACGMYPGGWSRKPGFLVSVAGLASPTFEKEFTKVGDVVRKIRNSFYFAGLDPFARC